jgi:ABC-2 type transport system ATP-binding protein
VAKEAVAALGTVVKHEPAEAVIQVPQDAVNSAVGRALQSLPVQDLNVENPPLEEVMSELFSRSRAAREAEGAAA